jgi:hypothetical protein
MSSYRDFQESQKAGAEKLLERGRAAYDVHHYAEAESLLRQVLTREPQSWLGHYYLSAALLAQSDQKPEKARDGLAEAKRTVGLRPDSDIVHFLLGWAYLCLRKPKDTLDAVQQGLRINPANSWGYALAGRAHLVQGDWEKAVSSAESGLRFEPEDTSLLNTRAEALIMLDLKAEARSAVEAALRSDPESTRAHTNQGWLALYEGHEREALAHFREAMRLDPTSEAARQGLLQSLHARNPLYVGMLKYYLWTRRLSTGEFWAGMVIISGVNSFLRAVARAFPPLLLLVLPYLAVYNLFVFFTWIGDSFFNFLLRLSPTGRLVLSKDEKLSASGCAFTGLLFLVNVAALVTALFARPGEYRFLWIFFLGCLLSAALMMPVSGIFNVDPSAKTRRAILTMMALLLGLTAACGWGGAWVVTPLQVIPLALFLLGWLLYPWMANLVILYP